MGRVDKIADSYVEEWAELDPIAATSAGIGGHDDRLTDLSPDGYEALAELDRATLARLEPLRPTEARELAARDAMRERLGVDRERYEAGAVTSEISVLSGALHDVRSVFDLMPIEGDEAVAAIASRLAQVGTALAQSRTTLLHAAAQGHVAATRQIQEVARQCDTWADPGGDNFWPNLVARVREANPTLAASRQRDLDRYAAAARDATVSYGAFLRDELAPRGRANQALGRDLYALASRMFLGAIVDLEDSYTWGFEELARIEAEMRLIAGKITSGGSVDDAVAALDADPTRRITGREPFRRWMQELADQTVSDLDGTHFDIPEQIRRLDACIAPTSDGGIYYTGPSEDFSRPGQMWWSVPSGQDSFVTWREVSTVYHEGVPGHHLQIGQTAARADVLNRWQRFVCWCSGHGEGWALYAERLMDELGYLEDLGDKMGMLDGQAFRACRVIVDIGMHLELEIPKDNPFDFHPGQRWTPQLGWEFLRAHCRVPDEQLRFELFRYLGWPGQAPAYKLGERIWLQARADARARLGAAFDLKAFHRSALDLGPVGLDPLQEALARL